MSDDNIVYGGWRDRADRGGHNDGNTPQGPTNMEARVARLEAHVDHMRQDIADIKTDLRGFRSETSEEFGGIRMDMRDDLRGFRSETSEEFGGIRRDMRDYFRLLFGALVVAALGLASLMAKGFGWLS